MILGQLDNYLGKDRSGQFPEEKRISCRPRVQRERFQDGRFRFVCYDGPKIARKERHRAKGIWCFIRR